MKSLNSNLRIVLLVSLVLNAGLIGGLALLPQQLSGKGRRPVVVYYAISTASNVAPAGTINAVRFGPMHELILPELMDKSRSVLLDLERGRLIDEPDVPLFDNHTAAAIGWLEASGADLGSVQDPEFPSVICYRMAVVPCPGDAWDKTSAADVAQSKALRSAPEPKREFVQPKKQQCYMFRTQQGSCGMLRLYRSREGGVVVRYRLVLDDRR